MNLDPIQVGFLSSLVAEILKFVPVLRTNDLTVALTAIVVDILGAFFLTGGSMASLPMIILASFASYKLLIQPLASSVSSPSQE